MSAPPETQAWEPIGDAGTVAGQPSRRFRKEVARVGTYKHPTDKWTLRLTPERLRSWADTFGKMKKAGVEVPLCDDHIVSADTARGWVVGFEVEGDKGMATIEAIGEDAIRAIARNGASVYVEPEFVDGRGDQYAEAITHIALTPTPVIPGMGDFVPIAASRNGVDKALTRAPLVRYYAASLDAPPIKEPPVMLEKLRKALKLADDAAEDAVLAKINEVGEAAAKLPDLQTQLDKAKKDADALTAKVAELTKDNKPEIDDETAADRAEVVEEKIDGLVTAGKITPAVAASLKPLLAGTAKARPAMMLSRKHAPEGSNYLARAIIDAIGKNDPKLLSAATGEKTGAQAFSRSTPGGEGNDDQVDAASQNVLRQAAGLPPIKK